MGVRRRVCGGLFATTRRTPITASNINWHSLWWPRRLLSSPTGWDTRIHLLSCHEYGLLFLVSIRMFDHAILAYETFATNITGERLLACVQAHVPPQVRLVVERTIGANLTFEGLVRGMLFQVHLQRPLFLALKWSNLRGCLSGTLTSIT